MIFDFLNKQKKINNKIKLTKVMIMSLNIPEDQKSLYIQALDILDNNWIEKLYDKLIYFVKILELKDINEINKNNYSKVTWMRKKEAIEKQKDLNSFSFLINNL